MLEIKCPKCGGVRLRSNILIKLKPQECYWCSFSDEKPPKTTGTNLKMEILEKNKKKEE